jgi:hypothetical protein
MTFLFLFLFLFFLGGGHKQKQEWTQEKKARFGLVRTMSERCLDRKSVIQEVLPVEEISQAAEESDVDIPAAANIGEITFPPFEQPQPQQPTPCPPTSGPKCELRGREALWDLFQSECAFLYDHIMVLKNVNKQSHVHLSRFFLFKFHQIFINGL